MEYSGGTWTNNGFGDRGWLAIALVIFALWKPINAIWVAFLFGGLYILYLYIPGLGRSMQEIFKMLPYLVTIIVLIITSLRKKKEQQPPESLGLAYFGRTVKHRNGGIENMRKHIAVIIALVWPFPLRMRKQ